MKRRKTERETTEEERNVVISVRHCAGELNDILQGARRKVQSNARVFAETGISVMFRAVDCYSDMYEKLNLKSREALERLFSKFSACEEVQDSQDAIEETEGNWRNFLTNIDREVCGAEPPSNSEDKSSDIVKKNVRYINANKYQLFDCQTNRSVQLEEYVNRYTCLFLACQPAYWPDCGVRWRHGEMCKVKSDLSQFKVGYAVVTWGPSDAVRSWAKQITRATKWTVLWDKTGDFLNTLDLKSGHVHIWSTPSLDFLGSQRSAKQQTILPPPTELNWITWHMAGAELVLCKPVVWDSNLASNSTTVVDSSKKKAQPETSDGSEIIEDSDNGVDDQLASECIRDRLAVQQGETKICLLHISDHLADFAPSGSIYQAALTCYARVNNTTEATVMESIRQNRRLCTPPESARLQLEASTGLYYDPETALYYDPQRGYFYDAVSRSYYCWSETDHRYLPANAMVQAEIVASQAAQYAAAHAATVRAAAEREAARRAALQVAAQLAEIRASKDDYAAYAYATCVLPQQEELTNDPGSMEATYHRTAAAASNIEASLKAHKMANHPVVPLVPYADDAPTTPPPPGL